MTRVKSLDGPQAHRRNKVSSSGVPRGRECRDRTLISVTILRRTRPPVIGDIEGERLRGDSKVV